ncbi:MAG: methylthioribose-1-phosphate isomerase [Methanoculleus sp. SDB]|nr:MAG: methylthioribose-1-phosphate isomerase [Methanoculleus sp. SDB]
MDTATISWDYATGSIRFIDQTLLPAEFEIIVCDSVERLATAIRRLEIRGAPALGAAGGYGVALAASRAKKEEPDAFFHEIRAAAELLRATRPTAINLGWGIDRVLKAVLVAEKPEDACRISIREAEALAREDAALCRRIGDHGAALLPDSCTVLTHCNAGALACVEWGTALGVIRSAVAAGKEIRVIACETRPLNQGSRLTAWELVRDGIDVRVIPDGSAAHLMRTGCIDVVVVGADRICEDVVFNKIGTYMHAVCARHHGIPFYIAAPYSTFDAASRESDVVIEERGREELARCGERMLLPDEAGVINPAFDATPRELITGIITEKGVIYPSRSQDSKMQ